LAAQLRASVEQLDQVVLGFQEWAGLISEQRWHYVDEQRSIVERFTSWVSDGRVPVVVAPDSWVRFGENFHTLLVSTMKPDRENGHSHNVDIALAAVEAEVEEFQGDRFPRSISLLQFCIGALCKAGVITGARERYSVLLTDELRSLYPEVDRVNFRVFDFQF